MSEIAFREARIELSVSNPTLAAVIEKAIRATVGEVPEPPRYPITRLRTFRRLASLMTENRLAGRIAIVRVTEPGLRRLPALVEELRAKGALGVQLVWDGQAPAREVAEPTVFAILEKARATKSGVPVMLAAERMPVLALRTAIATKAGAPCP